MNIVKLTGKQNRWGIGYGKEFLTHCVEVYGWSFVLFLDNLECIVVPKCIIVIVNLFMDIINVDDWNNFDTLLLDIYFEGKDLILIMNPEEALRVNLEVLRCKI